MINLQWLSAHIASWSCTSEPPIHGLVKLTRIEWLEQVGLGSQPDGFHREFLGSRRRNHNDRKTLIRQTHPPNGHGGGTQDSQPGVDRDHAPAAGFDGEVLDRRTRGGHDHHRALSAAAHRRARNAFQDDPAGHGEGAAMLPGRQTHRVPIGRGLERASGDVVSVAVTTPPPSYPRRPPRTPRPRHALRSRRPSRPPACGRTARTRWCSARRHRGRPARPRRGARRAG